MLTEKETHRCTQCGSKGIIDIRYVACVARSNWWSLNWPMPNTQIKLLDDVKIWAIELCDCSKVKGYIHFLVSSNKRTITFLKWTAFLFIVVCIGLVLSKVFSEKNPITGMMSNVMITICTLAALFGVLAIPVNIRVVM